MSIVKGRFLWDGILSPVSGTYTMSHGTTPGIAVLKVLPQSSPYAMHGDLIITDDNTTLRVPGCKVDKVYREQDDGGYFDVITIFDWRWRWRGFGAISGCYNQLDEHGKLIPWTIRSPKELAELCFKAMRVSRYKIDLPPGLTKEHGENFLTTNPPWEGVVPVTGTNQPVNWEAVPPATALDELCEKYGRRIVPRLSDYTMMIVKNGIGGELPDGSISKRTPTADDPEAPDGVAVIGAPTRYQGRFLLEAVGLEWDESFRPINELSYAPIAVVGKKQISTSTITPASVITGSVFYITINGFEFSYTAPGGSSATTVATAIAALINASNHPDVNGIATATASAGVVTVTGVNDGISFTVLSLVATFPSTFNTVITQMAQKAKRSWENADVPTFSQAMRTTRLTKLQAMDLAQKSVFKYYRLANCAINIPYTKPITVPGYGTIKRRQQIILTDKQVERIVPAPGDINLRDPRDPDGLPVVVNFYSGYEHNKPAAVYGDISIDLQRPWYVNSVSGNTLFDQIFVPFEVDANHQLIKFSGHVYANFIGAKIGEPAKLVLQTGVMVRDEETNHIQRFERFEMFGKKAPDIAEWSNMVVRKYEDLQLNIVGKYTANDDLSGFTILDGDPIERSKYYIEGMKAQYFQTKAEIREYNGFMAIDLDGAKQQVTWEFGDDGCSTTASLNTEHSVNIPPYPARRKAEWLGAAERALTKDAALPSRVGYILPGGPHS